VNQHRLRVARRALVALLVAFAAVPVVDARAAAPALASRPNFLFVLTDDLAQGDETNMPNVQSLIADAGVTFDNYFISDSVCCPSRTTTLRGQYAHNTGVKTNGGTNGGFETAYINGIEQDTIATRLHDAGYRTGLFGKYLNKYPGLAGERYVPPGWTEWSSPVRGNPYSQRNFTVNHDGKLQTYGNSPRDHADSVFIRQASRFIEKASDDRVPFFAFIPVYAPHSPARPAAEDATAFSDARAARGPAFDQPDVSKMPQFVRALPRFTTAQKGAIDRLYRRRLRSLQAVDRGIGQIITMLSVLRELDNTYVVFASDNGFHLGDHRLPGGKGTAYDTDIRVPLIVRGPGIEAGSHVSRLAGNVDLAPTIAELAGVRAAPFTDGRSLVSLLEGQPAPEWRRRYLVEHWPEEEGEEGGTPTQARKGTQETTDPDTTAVGGKQPTPSLGPIYGRGLIDDRSLLNAFGKIPQYAGVRSRRYLYVEYATGERELYDVVADPAETENLAGTKPAAEHVLAADLARLRSCREHDCRAAEERTGSGS
jgi:arylsulfatase A-like enzyme